MTIKFITNNEFQLLLNNTRWCEGIVSRDGLPRGVLPSDILKMRKKCPGLKVPCSIFNMLCVISMRVSLQNNSAVSVRVSDFMAKKRSRGQPRPHSAYAYISSRPQKSEDDSSSSRKIRTKAGDLEGRRQTSGTFSVDSNLERG